MELTWTATKTVAVAAVGPLPPQLNRFNSVVGRPVTHSAGPSYSKVDGAVCPEDFEKTIYTYAT